MDSTLEPLIPYLDSTEHPFILKITFPDRHCGPNQTPSPPFIILQDTTPLARLYLGKLVARSGTAFKDLYLLVQRDEYQLPADTPYPSCNPDVEHCWQEARRLSAEQGNENVTLRPVSSEVNDMLPFRSLLCCTFRDLFFHPVCPVCGGLLELCTDDTLLKTANLSPYSTSLCRYLHCPACSAAGREPSFFAPRSKKNSPSVVGNLSALIEGFAQLSTNTEMALPCTSCPETGNCYGPNKKARDRIIPFSFFPFHLLAFDTYPVDAIDYLNAPFPKAVETPQEDQKKLPGEAEPQPRAEFQQAEERAAAVIDMLMALRKKWAGAISETEEQPSDEEIQEAPPRPLDELPVEMLEKTMIFSPGDLQTPPHEPKKAPKKSDPEPPPAEQPPASSGEPDLEKTMIFSPGTAPSPSTPHGKSNDTAKKKKPDLESEALLETAIVSPNKPKGKK